VSQGISPKPEWLALLRGLEAIIGFGLLTASVSWLLSIYPVLEKRRSLAERASLLHNAELETHIDLIADCREPVLDWIMALAADLAALRNQMAQFPITRLRKLSSVNCSVAPTLSAIDLGISWAAASDGAASAFILGLLVITRIEHRTTPHIHATFIPSSS